MRFSSFAVSLVFTGTALFANAAPAADFRVLDFGAACDRIAELETTRGSQSFDGKLPSGYQFAFRTHEFDRDGLAVYSCESGKLFRGGYIFDAKDEADAAALYAKIKKSVTRERGSPSYDFAGAVHRKKMSDVGATLSRVDTLVAFWDGEVSEAHASVAEPSKDRGWRVSLSYTANSHVKE